MHTALKVIKGMGLACLAAALALNAMATPEVTGVSARQRWPWNNLVDVTFTVSGSDSAETFYRVDVSAVYPGVAGDRLPAQTLLDEPLVKGDGTYRFVWDMGADAPGLVTSNLTVQVTVAPVRVTLPSVTATLVASCVLLMRVMVTSSMAAGRVPSALSLRQAKTT